VSSGHFFSPWEIPSFSERSPEDCEQKMIKRLPHAFGKSDTILIIDSRTGHPMLLHRFFCCFPYRSPKAKSRAFLKSCENRPGFLS